MLAFLLWRMLALLGAAAGVAVAGWLLAGGPGKLLRARALARSPVGRLHALGATAARRTSGAAAGFPAPPVPRDLLRALVFALGAALFCCVRVLRLKKAAPFIRRVKTLDRFEHEREPPMNRLITSLAASGAPACVQLALTPTPASFERLAKHLYKRHEAHLSRRRSAGVPSRDRSLVEQSELRGGLDVQHKPLFFTDLR